MNTAINSLLSDMINVHEGEPWFGRPVFSLLGDVDPSKATNRPGSQDHSMLDILWHMNTWASFTLDRLRKDKEAGLKKAEELDWRLLRPDEHSWEKGMAAFRSTYDAIIHFLKKIPDDSFLEEKVDYRDYNFGYLLRGMTEHHIYHAGQIALMSKFT